MIVLGNTVFVGLLIVCLLPQQLNGAELFKWKDADGVTHYSDDPPPSSVTEFKSLEFQDSSASGSKPSPGATADADYFSVINQAKRMEASRLERERLRLEKQKLRQQQRSQQQVVIPDYTSQRRSYSVVYPFYDRYYPIHPYRHGYYHYVPHHKNHYLSPRPIGRARQRLSGSISSLKHGHRSRNARSRSIRLR